jgi:hypothetical protein
MRKISNRIGKLKLTNNLEHMAISLLIAYIQSPPQLKVRLNLHGQILHPQSW